jgi:hypothetical protein
MGGLLNLAPQVGLEPTTLRLTAECSAIELLRNKRPHTVKNSVKGAKRVFITNGKVMVKRGHITTFNREVFDSTTHLLYKCNTGHSFP